ncbi:MAG: hypothetical protein JST70_05335 [Bacteroidetes bacterium]|nr:hypothetical protein [Bacteroidota bacterium]
MAFNDAIQRLERYISLIKKALVTTAIIEAVLVISIGIVSNNINTDNKAINNICLILLLFFGIAYLLLLFAKTLYNKTFPGSITNELKAERELSVLKKDAERQKTISDFLVEVIKKLNGQTCALNYGDDTHLCDAGIRDGVHSLIQPVVDNVDFILDTINTQFTIGVYIAEYRSMAAHNSWDNGIIIIEDKLFKAGLIPKNLLEQANVRNEELEIQTGIRHSLNNTSFIKHDYNVGTNKFSLICSPIPLACNDDETNGVFFVISKHLPNIPIETEITLKIFNSVIANWIYRYNECVNNRQSLDND